MDRRLFSLGCPSAPLFIYVDVQHPGTEAAADGLPGGPARGDHAHKPG